MNPNSRTLLAAALAAIAFPLLGADITGKWKADFETQIGHLKYVYDLKADGENVTGKAFRDHDGQKSGILSSHSRKEITRQLRCQAPVPMKEIDASC